MDNSREVNVHIESEGERWRGVGVRRLTGREEISRLFSFELDVATPEDQPLGERAYPGAEVSLVIERAGVEVRRIHGILGPISDRLDPSGEYRTYRLRLLPRLFRLTLIETQEVYLDLTIPEIIKQKIELHGFEASDFSLQLVDSYPKREIVVQHGESDLAFISRLAEHVGISFFFEHDSGKDTLVVTDHHDGFGTIDGFEEVPFRGRGEESDGVFALEVTEDMVPGTFFVQDYNYRTPLLDPTGQFSVDADASGGIVEYGSHVKTPDEATALAKVRAQERLAQKKVYDGKSAELTASAGMAITLLDHPRLEPKEPLLLVAVEHDGTFPLFGEVTSATHGYKNSFRAIPGAVLYRPPRRTPKPRMSGVVTGIIQPGPGGEVGGVAMLTADGRYTVQLHFDTATHGQQKASHPVRLAQPFAGHGNGMHFPLLPGTEIIVAFANGDPDRPVIVGAMPNPVSPAAIVADEAHTHRIKSSNGVVIEFGRAVLDGK